MGRVVVAALAARDADLGEQRERALAAAPGGDRRCARIVSAIWLADREARVERGHGSWKTMLMRSPRSARSSSSRQADEVAALEARLPAHLGGRRRAGRGSPARAWTCRTRTRRPGRRARPRRTANDTSGPPTRTVGRRAAARRRARSMLRARGRVIASSPRGSRCARSPSPSRLNASTVMAIARPGKISAHGACASMSRPSDSISPRDGVGGWVPSPRNDSAASICDREAHQHRSPAPAPDPMALGSTWPTTMRVPRTPGAARVDEGQGGDHQRRARMTRARIGKKMTAIGDEQRDRRSRSEHAMRLIASSRAGSTSSSSTAHHHQVDPASR